MNVSAATESTRKHTRGAARAAEFTSTLSSQLANAATSEPASQLAGQQDESPAEQTVEQVAVKASDRPTGQHASKKRRKNVIDTSALMDGLRSRGSFDYTLDKVPMNGSISKELVDRLEDFCYRNKDSNGKPIKRYLVLSALIEELLEGEEQ